MAKATSAQAAIFYFNRSYVFIITVFLSLSIAFPQYIGNIGPFFAPMFFSEKIRVVNFSGRLFLLFVV